MMNRQWFISLNEDVDMSNPYKFDELSQTNITKVDNISQIEMGKWCFDSNERAYVISPLVDSAKSHGYFRFIPNDITVAAGDEIEVEFDIMNSGFTAELKTGITIDILKSDNTTIVISPNFTYGENTDEYVTFKKKYVIGANVPNRSKPRIVIGCVTSTPNGNSFITKIRDIKITITKNGGEIPVVDMFQNYGLGRNHFDDMGSKYDSASELPLSGARDITLKSGIYKYYSKGSDEVHQGLAGNGALIVLPYREKQHIMQLAVINLADGGRGVYYRGYNTTNGWSKWVQYFNNSMVNIILQDMFRIGGTAGGENGNYGIAVKQQDEVDNYCYMEVASFSPAVPKTGVYVYNRNGKRPEILCSKLDGTPGEKKWIMQIHTGSTTNRPKSSEWALTAGYQYFDTTLGKPIWYKSSDVWVDATGAIV